MIIKKVFNNNSVLVFQGNEDVILTGKGIGFGKREGDPVDETKIQKSYHSVVPMNDKYAKLLQKIPAEYFDVSKEIYDYACRVVSTPLDEQLVLDLADHISFAVERMNHIDMGEMFLGSEIHLAYPQEYEVGIQAVKIADEKLNIQLPAEEASYIAFHLILAEGDAGSSTPKELMDSIRMVLDCVYAYYPEVEEHMTNYAVSRLLVHLRFLGNRVLRKEYPEEVESSYVKKPDSNSDLDKCMEKITQEVREKHNYRLSDQEQQFLTLHLQRVLQEVSQETA